jgi:hypothetical protein
LGALIYEPPGVPVTIGSKIGSNTSKVNFTGLVDEVSFYNRPLTFNEIFDIYNADFTGKDVSKPYFTTLAGGGSGVQLFTAADDCPRRGAH